jgi:hypothetical protein
VTATSVNHIRTGHRVTCYHCHHQAIYKDPREAVRDYLTHKCPKPRNEVNLHDQRGRVD